LGPDTVGVLVLWVLFQGYLYSWDVCCSLWLMESRLLLTQVRDLFIHSLSVCLLSARRFHQQKNRIPYSRIIFATLSYESAPLPDCISVKKRRVGASCLVDLWQANVASWIHSWRGRHWKDHRLLKIQLIFDKLILQRLDRKKANHST